MSFKFQMKCFSERMKDIFLKGRSVPFQFHNTILINIDSRTLESFENFSKNNKEMDNFISLTKDKTCLMDIGAHHGVFSLIFTSINHKRLAYAFDPSSRVFDLLNLNIKFNPKNNIKSYQSVVSDNNIPVKMKFESLNQLSAVGENEKVKEHKKKNIVEAITIDQFVENNGISPDVFKIDTEGFEYQVLKGGINYLKKHTPLIFLEIHPPKLLNHGLNVLKLEKLLLDLGYKNIYDLDGNIIVDIDKYCDPKVPAYRVVVKK